MRKTMHKRKKLIGAGPELVEIYRNKDFITDSLDSVCASKVKVTADGQVTTKTVGNVGDRHLQAWLKLPELQERCAISTNKELYKLSTLLAETDIEARENAQEKVMNPMTVNATNKLQKDLKKSPWIRYAHVHPKECLPRLKQQDSTPAEKGREERKPPNRCRENRPVRQQMKNSMPPTAPPAEPAPDLTVRRKLKKLKRPRQEPPKQTAISSDESCYETAETGHRSIAYERLQGGHQQQLEPEIECYDQPLSTGLPLLLACNAPKASNVANKLKDLRQVLDDWHTYTMLLVLIAFGYLIYILCYDISIYVREERRYLAKMRSSGAVFRCFYYIMRLLKVPIF